MRVKIRTDDTLDYYSRLFGIPNQLIPAANQDVNPDGMQVGQEVSIPGFYTSRYTVRSGDTFSKLAGELNLPLDSLLLLNQGVDPERLTVNQIINLPVRVKTPVVNPYQQYDYQVMMADLQKLLDLYPFLARNDIGSSVMGKPIPEILIGNGEEVLHDNASFHANEWIGTPVLMYFLNNYALALTNQQPIRGIDMAFIYQQTKLSLVPMVNPDGVNLVINGPPNQKPYHDLVIAINGGSLDFSGWKANIRGVDLNLQFPANWEYEKKRSPDEPAPRDYAGPYPLSEPESIAMARLTEKLKFQRVISLHTQGQVIYWDYMGMSPPRSAVLAREFARVSGYKPVANAYSYAGYKDWFIKEFQRPGFTVEMGKGENPLPISQFDQIYQHVLGILLVDLYFREK